MSHFDAKAIASEQKVGNMKEAMLLPRVPLVVSSTIGFPGRACHWSEPSSPVMCLDRYERRRSDPGPPRSIPAEW